jgi:hypothetical protein
MGGGCPIGVENWYSASEERSGKPMLKSRCGDAWTLLEWQFAPEQGITVGSTAPFHMTAICLCVWPIHYMFDFLFWARAGRGRVVRLWPRSLRGSGRALAFALDCRARRFLSTQASSLIRRPPIVPRTALADAALPMVV